MQLPFCLGDIPSGIRETPLKSEWFFGRGIDCDLDWWKIWFEPVDLHPSDVWSIFPRLVDDLLMTVGMEKENWLLKVRRELAEGLCERRESIVDCCCHSASSNRVGLGTYDCRAHLGFMLCKLSFNPRDIFAEAACPFFFFVDAPSWKIDADN
ncbi:hypothetical protein OAK93_00180 [bacterium]|nr:hypothetical protein [bacterium]